MEKSYLKNLKALEDYAQSLPNTPLLAKSKVEALVLMNMRYERLMVDRNLTAHPYPMVENIIEDSLAALRAWSEASFIESSGSGEVGPGKGAMEQHHQELFQSLWVKFDEKDYTERISRYSRRLELNSLSGGFLKGRRCIDLGCGHGNFAHALLQAGAESVLGIDFGEASVRYGEAARQRLGVPETRLRFRIGSVYELEEPDESFDFALQNGVFHHLEDEAKAYREAHRVLKREGWMWIYTDGQGAISHDLWDASVRILAKIPTRFVLRQLENLNLETGKRYHLGDGLNAIYRHDSWNGLTSRLASLGFGNFRRLVGGFPTDFDHDAIAADRYGKDKFGDGDLRLLAQKVR